MPDLLHTAFRTLLFICILFLLTKLLGKRQVGQLSLFEYISGITIGSLAGEVIIGLEENILQGTLSIIIFGGVTYFVDSFSLRSKKFSDITEGKPSVFIQDGKILEDNLKKEMVTIDEMLTLLRQKNVFNISDVEFAVMEPNGEISILLKKEKQPITPEDLGLTVVPEKESKLVIREGKINYDSLKEAKKTPEWLEQELKKRNITVDNVFLGMINTQGELAIDLYDHIQSTVDQAQPQLLEDLRKCQTDLENLAQQTIAQSAKDIYMEKAKDLANVIEMLAPYLRNK